MNIVFSTDNNGVEMCLTSIYSIAKNNTEEDLRVYVLDSDLTNTNKAYFKKLDKRFSNLEIIFIEVSNKDIGRLRIPRKDLSVQAYFRYLIPELLPDEERALYMDIDLLCIGQLAPLYKSDIKNYHIAGVEDYDVMHERGMRGIKQIVPTRYINTGVLLMNLAKIRADDLTIEFFQNAGERRRELIPESLDIFVDQTIANLTFKKKKQLNNSYNVLIKTVDHFDEIPVVLHYSGFYKPFSYDAQDSTKIARYMTLYRQYYFEVMDLVGKSDYDLITTVISAIRTQYSKQSVDAQAAMAQQQRHIVRLENEIKSIQNENAELHNQVRYLQTTKGIIKSIVRKVKQD